MEPYNPNAKCRKCGYGLIASSYRDAANRVGDWDAYVCADHGCPETPHIHRHCKRCHYEWVEAPLDAVARMR